MWTVFDHPRDFPDHFIARKALIADGKVLITPEILTATDLEDIRMRLERAGLVCLSRSPLDEPQIVEVWL